MLYRLLADGTLLLHFAFILFVIFGGLLVLYRTSWCLVHLPSAAWGLWIEWSGRICPLTPLENRFRKLAGEQGYDAGFIEHYLLPTVYPAGLTHDIQLILGVGVLIINLLIYAFAIKQIKARPSEG